MASHLNRGALIFKPPQDMIVRPSVDEQRTVYLIGLNLPPADEALQRRDHHRKGVTGCLRALLWRDVKLIECSCSLSICQRLQLGHDGVNSVLSEDWPKDAPSHHSACHTVVGRGKLASD